MKIKSTKIGNGLKAPFTAQVFQLIGILQFVGASWFVFSGTALLSQYIGPDGVVIGLVIAVCLGVCASLFSFAIARVIQDIYAIRWHTMEYSAERTSGEVEEMRLLRQSLDRLSHNIEAMYGAAEPVESLEEDVPAPLPAPDAYDAYDAIDEPEPEAAAPVEAPPAIPGAVLKLLYILAGLLVVAIVFVVIAILRR